MSAQASRIKRMCTSKNHEAMNALASVTMGTARLRPMICPAMVSTTSKITAATPACMPFMTRLTIRLERNAS